VLPIYFESGGAQLFGMYHAAAGTRARRAGVLICAPFGHEYIRAHRALRQLAVALSDRGHHVLRFDYFGCGDSDGDASNADVGRWMGDISAAIDELKATAAVNRVCLVGVRLGATMAAQVATVRPDVDAVFLWDPVEDGGEFLRGLEELQRQWLRGRPGSHRFAHASAVTEVIGFELTPRLRRSIAPLRLAEPPAPRHVVVDPEADWHVPTQAHAGLLAPHMVQRLASLVEAHAS
jgi:pimeloyl-ACP methyl ester carboxylesterase